MNKAPIALWVAGCLFAQTAAAQPPAPAPQPPPRPPAAATAAPTPAPEATPGTGPAEPTLPEVSDPMLAPPPPPTRVLASWRQAIDLARRQSTELRTAVARVDLAAGQAREALAGALPTLDGNARLTHHLLRGDGFDLRGSAIVAVRIPDPPTTLTAGLGLTVPVFAPAAWHQHGTAKDAIDATRLSQKDAERRVVAGIADAIVVTLTAERLAEISRVSLASALSTLDLNRRRAALGASSTLDVLRVDQEVQLARAQLISADESLFRAREALGLALGSQEGFGVAENVRLDTLAQDAQSVCRSETTVDKRADVQRASADVALAERRREGVDWTFWPTVAAVSDLGYINVEERSANGEHVTWTIGGVLNWQLYDGGVRYSRREQAAAEATIAHETLTDTRRRATLEVSQAARAVRVAQANLAVSTRARELASETARLARVAFMNGSGTSFDLVDTARTLREAELDLAIKEFDLLRAQVAAYLALASCNV